MPDRTFTHHKTGAPAKMNTAARQAAVGGFTLSAGRYLEAGKRR
jgi:hypothetical protein